MLSKKNFWIGFFVVSFYALASYLLNVKGYYNKDLSQLLDRRELVCFHTDDNMAKYFQLLFPFLVILPFSLSYFEDCESNMIGFWLRRTGRKKYHIARAMVCFLGSFFMIALPFFVNLLLVWTTFPQNGNLYLGTIHTELFSLETEGLHGVGEPYWYPFLSVYLFHPFVYNCMYILFLAVLSGILGVVAYVSSFFIKKHKLVLFLPVYLFIWVLSMLTPLANDFELDPISYAMRGLESGNYLYFVGIVGILTILSVILIKMYSKRDVQ